MGVVAESHELGGIARGLGELDVVQEPALEQELRDDGIVHTDDEGGGCGGIH